MGLHERNPLRAWAEPYDPTLLSRRLTTQFEFEDRAHGDAAAKWFWNLRWAVRIDEDLAFGVQVEAPLRRAEEGGATATGVGDIETRIGIVQRLSPTVRWAILAVNLKFSTATDPLLGDGVLEARPISAVRWDATDRLQLGINVEYNFTPRDEGPEDVSALELKLPATFKVAEDLSAAASFNPRWNYLADSTRHRVEFGLTRLFGSRNEYALSVGAEIPLTHDSLDWKGSLGLTWYFP